MGLLLIYVMLKIVGKVVSCCRIKSLVSGEYGKSISVYVSMYVCAPVDPYL